MKRKHFFAIIGLVILFRICMIFFLWEGRRGVPIELDDSLAYIMHAAVLEKDPSYQSPFLKSFLDLNYHSPQESWADWHQNRIFHRMKIFYHGGHAFLIYLLKKITGIDYFTIWWGLLIIFNIASILIVALLIERLHSALVASIAIILYAFSFLIMADHPITAAPREWSQLFFLISVYLLVGTGKQLNFWKKVFYCVVVLLSCVACLSFHSIGKILMLELSFIGFMWMVFSFSRKTVYNFIFICFLGLFSWLIAYNFFSWVFHVPKIDAASLVHLNFQRGIIYTGLLFCFNTIFHVLKMSFVSMAMNSFFRGACEILLVLILIGGIWQLFSKSASRIRALFLAILLTQIGMYFVAIDYKPYVNYAYFEEYHYSIYFIFLTTVFGIGSLLLLRRLFRKTLLSSRSIFILLMCFLGLSIAYNYTETQKVSWQMIGATLEHVHPEGFVKKIEVEMQKQNTCIVVNDEITLYSLMTFGSYQYNISYNEFCKNSGEFYSNAISSNQYKYIFINTHLCRPNVSFEVIFEEGYLLLAKID